MKYKKRRETLKLLIGKYGMLGCWRFEFKYPRIDSKSLHQEWARGEGEIVRHLCGDASCVNPLHMIRGSDIENAEDEIKIRDFIVEVFQSELGEVYNDRYDNNMSVLILMPRMVRASKGKFKNMKDVHYYGREEYRRCYEEIITTKQDVEKELFDYMLEKFRYLIKKHYIELITL